MKEALTRWIAVRRTSFGGVAGLLIVGLLLFAVGAWMSISYPAASGKFPIRFLQMMGLVIFFDGGARWRLRKMLKELEDFVEGQTEVT
jgi:hypothetical protein